VPFASSTANRRLWADVGVEVAAAVGVDIGLLELEGELTDADGL
jgi:hypothetical protein